MTGLLLLFGLLALAVLVAVATVIALLWIWGRRQPESPPPCTVCGKPGCTAFTCLTAMQDEFNNARLLARDSLLEFTDVTGRRRIDPATVTPGFWGGIPIQIVEGLPDDEVRVVSDNEVYVIRGLGGPPKPAFLEEEAPRLDFTLRGPTIFDWQRDRAWSERRV